MRLGLTGVVVGGVVLAACGQSISANSPGQSAQFIAGYRVHPLLKDAAPKNTAAANLQYYGGHVVSNAKVYSVNWNSSVNPQIQSGMEAFYTAVTNSAYFDWLSEYNTDIKAVGGQAGTNQQIGRGSFAGSVTLKPSTSATTIDDTAIQTELNNQIGSGALPAPDANTIYMVNFPKGMTITQGGSASCQVFCAYHGTFQRNSASVFYAVLPSLEPGTGCDTGCGSDPSFLNNTTSVASHEMIETVTDAEVGLATAVGPPLAWYDSSQGEIGDICNAQQGSIVGADGKTYVVQKQWSNKAGACIDTGSGGGTDGGTGGGGGGGTDGGTGGGTCGHALCSAGGALTPSCDPCATQVCAQDSYCCTTSWDSQCVGEVGSICGQTCH